MIRLDMAGRDLVAIGTNGWDVSRQSPVSVSISISEEDARSLYAYLGNKLRMLGKAKEVLP